MTEVEALQGIGEQLQVITVHLERLHFLAVALLVGVGFIAGQLTWFHVLRLRDERGVWGE